MYNVHQRVKDEWREWKVLLNAETERAFRRAHIRVVRLQFAIFYWLFTKCDSLT